MPKPTIASKRVPFTDKPLISARPFPSLTSVTLYVVEREEGKIPSVERVFEHEKDATPQAHDHWLYKRTWHLPYPAQDLPNLYWSHGLKDNRNTATNYIEQHRLGKMPRVRSKLYPLTLEALFLRDWIPTAEPDLRGSFTAGPDGPAPMPDGCSWPQCPTCSKKLLFSQSMDMRDIAYAELLPGTTMVVFICKECLWDGNWDNCAAVIWLPANKAISLHGEGDRSLLRQANHFYGSDNPMSWELPEELQAEICGGVDEINGMPTIGFYDELWLESSAGTKVGGFPVFLQDGAMTFKRKRVIMEYIAQIDVPINVDFNGIGHIYYSVATGETCVQFQAT